MNKVTPRSHILVTIGNIAMLVGAIDPMEGAFIILPGSGLVLLGTYLSHSERWLITYHLWVFLMITVGVAVLLGATMLGGIGGTTEYSIWWGLLLLPYPIGWFMGICSPDSQRWVLWLGIGVGLWYLLMPILLTMIRDTVQPEDLGSAGIILGVFGVLIITGCIYRLRKRKA